ncbi:hypothetical protein GQ53DRAFT_743467 [Thozetella sp. PMI_491]|nr:hypothetical protein GQ53DRAFT_743467 [Thozetella sp. PMI_491]
MLTSLRRAGPLSGPPGLVLRALNSRSFGTSAPKLRRRGTGGYKPAPPRPVRPQPHISDAGVPPAHEPGFRPPPPPPRGRRLFVWGTIGANLYVFSLWVRATGRPDAERKMRENFTLSQENLREGRYWTLLTSAFSHATLPHLAFNMFAFHFGTNLAFYRGLGTGRFLALSLGSILVSSACSMVDETTRKGPSNNPHAGPVMYQHLGASGMVQGIITAMALTLPYFPVQLMFIPIEFSLWQAAVGFVGWDLYNLLQARKAGSKLDGSTVVGYAAHLGGAAFGAAYYMLRLRYRFGGAFPPRR